MLWPNRSKMILAMFVILMTNFFSLALSAESKVEQLLNKLDQNYYYPQSKGLTRVSSQLEWEQINIKPEKVLTRTKSNFIFEGEL
jgi:hypothetical protein